MPPTFRVRTADHTVLHDLHGMWPEERQRALLEELLDEPSSLTGADLTEMLELALQDLEPEAAGAKLLETLLGDEMSRGMRNDVAGEMMDGEPWVHHANMAWHRPIFEACWLAYKSHGATFTRPHGARLSFAVQATDDDSRALLGSPPTPALAARLVAGTIRTTIMGRLFDDQLEAESFPDAPYVVWYAEWSDAADGTATLTVEGSDHWFGSVEPGDWVEFEAWPDAEPED